MSISAITERAELLAEAGQQWLAIQQRKAQFEQPPPPQAPTENDIPASEDLISSDLLLRRELAALDATTVTAAQAAALAQSTVQ